jgi:uncharacterized protein
LQPLATSVVVSDAGPLISLGRLDHLSLLGQLFSQVQVPRLVLEECVAQPERPDAVRIQAAVDSGLLILCEAHAVQVSGLDAGESAAIGRAVEIHAGLLADDMAARLHATRLGVPVIGTLGVLVRAKRRGLVLTVAPLIERLRASGQRLSHGAVAEALAAAGEALDRN